MFPVQEIWLFSSSYLDSSVKQVRLREWVAQDYPVFHVMTECEPQVRFAQDVAHTSSTCMSCVPSSQLWQSFPDYSR